MIQELTIASAGLILYVACLCFRAECQDALDRGQTAAAWMYTVFSLVFAIGAGLMFGNALKLLFFS